MWHVGTEFTLMQKVNTTIQKINKYTFPALGHNKQLSIKYSVQLYLNHHTKIQCILKWPCLASQVYIYNVFLLGTKFISLNLPETEAFWTEWRWHHGFWEVPFLGWNATRIERKGGNSGGPAFKALHCCGISIFVIYYGLAVANNM